MSKKTTILLLSIYLYWNFRYVEFHAVHLGADEFVISTEKQTPKFYDNLKKVLNHYEEDFKEENGMVYIRYKLYKDEELVWNYTTKANDPVWLSTR